MRDKATTGDIYRTTALLRDLWLKHPHQRLGQLLLNLARNASGAVDEGVLWNLDEQELQKRLLECDWAAPTETG